MTLSEYIKNIDNRDKFRFIVVSVLIVWFFTSYKVDVSFLVGLIVACAVVYYMSDSNVLNITEKNITLETKLNGLLKEENRPPPKYFYIDPDMITFFDSIKDFRIYNRDSYVRAIRTADNLLGIRKELENDFFYTQEQELEPWQNFELTLGNGKTKNKEKSNIHNYREIFESAESMGKKSLNYLQAMLISLPVNKFYTRKHKSAMDRYHILIKRNTDAILHHCKFYSRDSDPILGVNYGKARPYEKITTTFEYFT